MDRTKYLELKKRLKGDSHEKPNSFFRQVTESDLLDWKPAQRAVIKEIAFLTVNDPDFKGPEYSPYRGHYQGWCFASQETLALRCGCSVTTVQSAVDGAGDVVETRSYINKFGVHNEYRIAPEKLVARKFDDEDRVAGRDGNPKKKNSKSFRASRHVAVSPHGRVPQAQTAPSPDPHGTVPQKVVDFDVDSLPFIEPAQEQHQNQEQRPSPCSEELKSQSQNQNPKALGFEPASKPKATPRPKTQNPPEPHSIVSPSKKTGPALRSAAAPDLNRDCSACGEWAPEGYIHDCPNKDTANAQTT